MPFFPPLTAMLSSASTDLAKTWLGRKGWPEVFRFLHKNDIVPTSGWGKKASASALMLINCFVDWYHREDTPTARLRKAIISDIPSEYMERMADVATTPPTDGRSSLWSLSVQERAGLLANIRTLDPATQQRMRMMLDGLDLEALKAVAATAAADLVTLVDLMAPPTPPRTDRPSLGNRLDSGLNGLADFLAPGLGR
jgi:hypothetical protein